MALLALTWFAGAAALVYGLMMSLSLCAFGTCSEPENADLGELLLLVGVPLLFVGAGLGAATAGTDHPALRAVIAVPLAISVGLVLVVNDVPDRGQWAENLTLYVMIVAGALVLIPLRRRWDAVGLVAGAVVAILFGEAMILGVATGSAVAAAALVWSDHRHPRHRRTWPS